MVNNNINNNYGVTFKFNGHHTEGYDKNGKWICNIFATWNIKGVEHIKVIAKDVHDEWIPTTSLFERLGFE
jgi:hypothetical protein